MSGEEREIVHFSLGFGIFHNDDELTNGWNVSAAQAPYQGQNVEEVEEGADWEDQQFSEGLHEEDIHLAGQCEMCQEASQHNLSLEETNVLEMREKIRIKQLCASHYSGLVTKYSFFPNLLLRPVQSS